MSAVLAKSKSPRFAIPSSSFQPKGNSYSTSDVALNSGKVHLCHARAYEFFFIDTNRRDKMLRVLSPIRQNNVSISRVCKTIQVPFVQIRACGIKTALE